MKFFLFPEAWLVGSGNWLQIQACGPSVQAVSCRQHASQEEEAGSAWCNKGSMKLRVQCTLALVPARTPTSFVTVDRVLWALVFTSGKWG